MYIYYVVPMLYAKSQREHRSRKTAVRENGGEENRRAMCRRFIRSRKPDRFVR